MCWPVYVALRCPLEHVQLKHFKILWKPSPPCETMYLISSGYWQGFLVLNLNVFLCNCHSMAQRFPWGPNRVTLQRPWVLFLKVFNLRVFDPWLNCCGLNPTTVRSETPGHIPCPPWSTNYNLTSISIQQGKSPKVTQAWSVPFCLCRRKKVCVSVHVGMWIETRWYLCVSPQEPATCGFLKMGPSLA